MNSLTSNIRTNKAARLIAVIFCITGLFAAQLPAAPVVISTSITFADLNALPEDINPDPSIFQTNEDFTLAVGGEINSNDDFAGSVPNSSATSQTYIIGGSFLMQTDTGIFAENRDQGGTGGDITMTIGGSMTLQSGATISSSRIGFANAGIKNAGNQTYTVGTHIDLQTGSKVIANDPGGKAGDISMTAGGSIHVDGLVTSGPTDVVLSTKLDGYVLERGVTTQRGGAISIISLGSLASDHIEIGTNAVIASQGEDPASDEILISGCAVNVLGLVASVSKKSNGSPGNFPKVTILADEEVTINGSDLGGAGPNQGRVRADYIEGEAPIPHGVDIFANGGILVIGPNGGDIYAISANGGSNTNQEGGTVRVYSLEGDITLEELVIQASASVGSGGKGGEIDIQAALSALLDTAIMDASGSNTGGAPQGGEIFARAFNGDVIWTGGVGDASGAASGGLPSILLKYFGTVDTTGTIFNPAAVLTQDTSGGAPVLPAGIQLPECAAIPLPTAATMSLAMLAGLGLIAGIRRRFAAKVA